MSLKHNIWTFWAWWHCLIGWLSCVWRIEEARLQLLLLWSTIKEIVVGSPFFLVPMWRHLHAATWHSTYLPPWTFATPGLTMWTLEWPTVSMGPRGDRSPYLHWLCGPMYVQEPLPVLAMWPLSGVKNPYALICNCNSWKQSASFLPQGQMVRLHWQYTIYLVKIMQGKRA